MDLGNFHSLVGQTIMYCQIIEHDVKLIYAAMLKGDFYENLEIIKTRSLGQAVQKLKDLDFSNNKPYISASDYNFLKQMSNKRNHWCHETYQNFIYNNYWHQSKEYSDECRKLEHDNVKLRKVSEVLQAVRIQTLRDFNRV